MNITSTQMVDDKPLVYFIDCVGKSISDQLVNFFSDQFHPYCFKSIDARHFFNKTVAYDEWLKTPPPMAIIISGSMSSVNDDESWIINLQSFVTQLLNAKTIIPLFGVCFGHQIIAKAAGATVSRDSQLHEGIKSLNITHHTLLTKGINKSIKCYSYHQDVVDFCPNKFSVIFSGDNIGIQGICHDSAPVYSHQGHPEAPYPVVKLFNSSISESELGIDGQKLLSNFLNIATNYWEEYNDAK